MIEKKIIKQIIDEMPYALPKHLVPCIKEAMRKYASQQRTEGIKEGFEAAREVKAHNVDGDKERVNAILALWNNSLAEHPTVDDYLSTKR